MACKLSCSWACGFIYLIFLLLPDRCCCPLFTNLMSTTDTMGLAGKHFPTKICHNKWKERLRDFVYFSGDTLIVNGLRRAGGQIFGSNGEMRSDGTFMTAATLVDHDLVVNPNRNSSLSRSRSLNTSSSQPGSNPQNNFAHM